MTNSFDAFRETGSNWRLKSVEFMEQTIIKYRPLRGSCFSYVIPETLLRKNCLLNVTGPPALDGECFRYSVLAALHTDPDLVGTIPWSDLHQHKNTLSFEGIGGSGRHMPVASFQAFEEKNKISINLYGFDEKIFPIYISSNHERHRHVDLLLLPERKGDGNENGQLEETEDVNFNSIVRCRKPHYCAIKDLNRLVASQVGRHFTHICRRCLTPRYSQESMDEHERICSQGEDNVVCVMPSDKQKWLKFRNYARILKVSFVIVANFSCYTCPLYDNDEETEGYENRERRLDPCAYSYQRISIDDCHPKDPVFYRGDNAEDTMEHFLADMAAEEAAVFHILEQTYPTTVCNEGLDNMEATNDVCFVCRDPFLPGERIVVDHSHVSGKIRGRCHNACNLRLKEVNFLPIVLENLSKHEGRLIMHAVGKFGAESITVIPQTIDTFVSISIKRCRYIDFSRFLKTSLDDLIESLRNKSGTGAFTFTLKEITQEHIDVSIRRQYMFHDYLDCPERLCETDLPPISAFSKRIAETSLTDEEYSQIQEIWSSFNMKNLDDYLKQYLITRCALFADVVENFRNVLMKDFFLDPMQYYSLPGYSFDCCLYKSEVTLELITDEDIHNTILHALRGGVTVVGSPRLCTANSPDLTGFDPDAPISKTVFLDYNSLYPSCMIDFPLPVFGFRYLCDYDIERLDITQIPKDSAKGYILVVDLEYPEELHDRDDGYPMCPENKTITAEMLSPYTQGLADQCGITLKGDKKLCQTLSDKSRYVKFKHHAAEILHSICPTHVEKMSLAYEERVIVVENHGKTIENQKKRINVKICTNAGYLERLVRKPAFAAARVFSENLAAVQLYNEKVLLNKPIAIGFSVLESSKRRIQTPIKGQKALDFRTVQVEKMSADEELLPSLEVAAHPGYRGDGWLAAVKFRDVPWQNLNNGIPARVNYVRTPASKKIKMETCFTPASYVFASSSDNEQQTSRRKNLQFVSTR
ncbi:uncharacterized protein LOC128546803 [Mercenaria mercenaria]|uniref:uncharacterized protein LOC128546803 n=1 Tax=Mercenaria mercenaria TaxID=6596 RepID=UPI00234F866C|nr:uncharacterized protein LOC128546803 [Mercenaria mercenaria]